MVKNIGIVTWTKSANYGTELQAFALAYAVKKLGANPFFLNWFTEADFNLKRQLQLLLIKRNEKKRLKNEFANELKYQRTLDFEKRFLTYHKDIKGRRTLKNLLKNTFCFISGSDQILNPNYVCPFYFLSFAKECRKVTYASSIGVSSLNEQQKELYKNSLTDFYALSSREKEGADILSDAVKKDVSVVLDPTLLLNKEQWTEVIRNADVSDLDFLKQKYILCYFVGDNDWYWEHVKRIKQQLYIDQVVVLPLQESHRHVDGIVYESAGPIEFLYLIQNSTLVCTDSFHATAFCINLQKQFVEFLRFKNIDEKSQNSRIYDVFERFNLSGLIVDETTNNVEVSSVDFSLTESVLERERKLSFEFLSNSIGK